MIQLAATTATTNITKQYRPYLTIAFGVDRCVIPKTTEAKEANIRTAVKWEGAKVKTSFLC